MESLSECTGSWAESTIYHVEYSGQEAVIGLDGTVLEGKLPKSQMKLVDAWMEIHKDDLAANWTLLSNGEQFFRIDPLK